MKASTHNEAVDGSSPLVDAVGCSHPALRAGEVPRIVSLVPSITELLCDLGLEEWLVGRTGFCVHPAGTVRRIPKVGGTKDARTDKLLALSPTHLIVNIDENRRETVEQLRAHIPNVIVTHPLAPRDNLALYRLLGGIFGAGRKAEDLCATFEHEYAALQAAPKGPSRTVLYCIWKDPWMTVSADTYIARMMAEIGWRCWQAPTTERYPAFEWSQLQDAVDGILLSTEPYSFMQSHADALADQTGKPVRLVDGEMMSWYGSRAIAGLRYLRELISFDPSGRVTG